MLKVKGLKGFLLIIAFMVFAVSVNSALAFTNSSEGITVNSSNVSGIDISYQPRINSIDTIYSQNGEMTLLPKIAGAKTVYSSAGKPLQIVYTINLTVPSPTGFELSSSSISSLKILSGKITPTPNIIIKNEFPEEIYIPDNSAYNSVSLQNQVSIKYAGISRDRYIAEINIIVSRYNPSTNSIEIPEKVNISVKFNPQIGISNNLPITSEFGSDLTINQKETSAWRIPNSSKPEIELKSKNDNIASQENAVWLKITVDAEGVYSIDANALAALGISISQLDIPTLKVYGNTGDNLSETVTDALTNGNKEQAIIVRTNQSGDFQNLIFYGAPSNGFKYQDNKFESYFNHYSNSNYYLLTWGGAQGRRAQAIEKTTDTPSLKPTTYIEKLMFFEEKNNGFVGGSGKVWFGGTIFPRNFTNMLYNLDRSGEVNYRFYLSHRATETGTFSISESKTKIAEASLVPNTTGSYWDAVGKIVEAKIPASSISSDNRSYLALNYSNIAISTASAFFNWYEIFYPRSFVPINNEIGFFTNPEWEGVTEFTLNSFSTGEIIGWDITNKANPLLIKNTASTGGMFIFKDTLTKSSPRRYFVSSELKTPKLEKTLFGNYNDTKYNAELIVITPPAFIQSANKYKEYREKNFPVKVGVFRTDLIYNEFGSGISDPTAIRDFLATAFNKWDVKPKYVLLWGDGHYDYKNIQSQTPNYIPAFESIEAPETFDATRSYSSDDFFARIIGNDLKIDLAIGRIPIDNNQRGDLMLQKIIGYEQNASKDPWRSVVTLLADDSPTGNSFDGNVHTNQSESISKYFLPIDIQQKKIYLADYPAENVSKGRRKPKVTADMLSVINTTGTILVNWIGHGNPRVWAHEEILDRDKTIPMMKNPDKLFFTTAATCDFGRFDMPDLRCGAEELLLSSQGGSIGVFSATRVVYSGQNEEINQKFYSELFKRDANSGNYRKLGDVYFGVKQEKTDLNDQKYFLLGDPYLTLLLPNNYVQIDSINGKYVGDGKDTAKIKALSRVSISGRIFKPGTTQVDTSFNGNAIVTMFDSDLDYQDIDIDNTIHYITKFGGALNRSSALVENGIFTTSFFIPEDISYQKTVGRINAYAFTPDNKYAEGANRCFVLNGLDTTNIGTDTRGPDVEIYLDTLTFKDGDIVSKKPLLIVNLFDENGINATGNGIGHRIEAWFDDSPVSIDLTDKFVSSLVDSRFGSAEQYIFDLLPGVHKVKVRAWDVFNNYTIGETSFRIARDGEGVLITQINNFPNPFDNETVIKFEHNLSELFSAELRIFTPEGRLVKNISEDINSVHTSEIKWNGTDNYGVQVLTGAYIYDLTIRTKDGLLGRKNGVAAFIK